VDSTPPMIRHRTQHGYQQCMHAVCVARSRKRLCGPPKSKGVRICSHTHTSTPISTAPSRTHAHASHIPLTHMHLHVQWDVVAWSRRIRGARRPTPCQSKEEADCGQSESSECSVQPQWSTSAWAKKMKRGKGNSWERRGSQRDGGGVAYTRTGAGWAADHGRFGQTASARSYWTNGAGAGG
jgi:hypothetical protein